MQLPDIGLWAGDREPMAWSSLEPGAGISATGCLWSHDLPLNEYLESD